jgi:hypothetical protein
MRRENHMREEMRDDYFFCFSLGSNLSLVFALVSSIYVTKASFTAYPRLFAHFDRIYEV